MGKYKICVYAICKNEINFVDKWMDSMSEADMIVVLDTGSDDGTAEKLRERGAVVHTKQIIPWRFDKARNVSLDYVPDDVDICVCTDLDEVFDTGWRNHLESAWDMSNAKSKEPVARMGKYLYNWSLKPDGTPDVQFNYFKVHDRRGFRWVCPVHEHIIYEGDLPEETVFILGMVLNHYPDSSKARSSYLPLLELAVDEDSENERMRYYLGREYMYKEKWQKCIDTLRDFLEMPSAVWKEERCAAMRWIAHSSFSLNQTENACCWYFRAIAEAPHMRDAYVEFAKMCYQTGNWPMTYFLSNEALKIKTKSPTYVNMGYAWDHTPNDLCAIAAHKMHMTGEALRHAATALALSPDNERLKNNVAIISAAQK